jgi:hypothetical protein
MFEKTRQKPSKLVLMLRGIAKGESTARLARELSLSRKHMHLIRHRVQRNLLERLPTGVLESEVQFEADELYQNAGGKSDPHTEAGDPPRRRANKVRGRGTYDKDRPPIFILVARNVGEVRYFVRKNADSVTCNEWAQGSG